MSNQPFGWGPGRPGDQVNDAMAVFYKPSAARATAQGIVFGNGVLNPKADQVLGAPEMSGPARSEDRKRLEGKNLKPALRKAIDKQIQAGMEHKFQMVTSAIWGAPAQPAVMADLTAVPQGTTQQTRVGNAVNIERINVRGVFYSDDTTPVQGFAEVRLVVFQWRSPAPPTMADIFQAGVNRTTAMLNAVKMGRQLRVLFDERYQVASKTDHRDAVVDVTISGQSSKLFSNKVHYSADSLTSGTNHVWAIWISNQVLDYQTPNAFAQMIFYFTDA